MAERSDKLEQKQSATHISELLQMFVPAIVSFLESDLRTPANHVYFKTVVGRTLYNRVKLCHHTCPEKDTIHFHESKTEWWMDPSTRVLINDLIRRTETATATEAYVQELIKFTHNHKARLVELVRRSKETTQSFLENIITDETLTLIREILQNKSRATEEFRFYCALICTLMDMMENDEWQDDEGFGFFELFLQFYLDDGDGEDEDGDAKDDDEPDDDDEEDDDAEEPETDEEDDDEDGEAEEEEEPEVLHRRKKPRLSKNDKSEEGSTR
jgi:hypothetical protein